MRFLRSLAAAVLLSVPGSAFAQSTSAATPLLIYCGGLPGCTASGTIPFTEQISSVLTLLLLQLPLYTQGVGVLFIMIGGAYILLSSGNEEYVTKGKKSITWSVIAIFITQFASEIVGFVQSEVQTRVASSDLVMSVVETLAGSIMNLFYTALVAVAVYSGMRMVLAFGKEDQFKKAQEGLFYAALGAIIINASQQIYNAFFNL